MLALLGKVGLLSSSSLHVGGGVQGPPLFPTNNIPCFNFFTINPCFFFSSLSLSPPPFSFLSIFTLFLFKIQTLCVRIFWLKWFSLSLSLSLSLHSSVQTLFCLTASLSVRIFWLFVPSLFLPPLAIYFDPYNYVALTTSNINWDWNWMLLSCWARLLLHSRPGNKTTKKQKEREYSTSLVKSLNNRF